MMKSHDELAAALKAAGLSIDGFTLRYEGGFNAEDVDWNYKDVLHLFHMHPGTKPVLGIVEHDKAIYINLQKVFGIRMPLSVVSYQSPGSPETYYTTGLFYTLVVSILFTQLDPSTCRVETRYTVGVPKLLVWMFPVLRWVIKRNYRWLMEDDLPMRRRRMDLRSRGYTFRRAGNEYGFIESLDIARLNVVPPRAAAPFAAVEIDLNVSLPPEGEISLGDDGHLGLRLVREGSRIMAFPRMCEHEGASLDGLPCRNRRIKCPWHGRLVPPLAELDLARDEGKAHRAGSYLLTRSGAVLRVEPYADGGGEKGAHVLGASE